MGNSTRKGKKQGQVVGPEFKIVKYLQVGHNFGCQISSSYRGKGKHSTVKN